MKSHPRKRWLAYAIVAVVFTFLGLLLAGTELGTSAKRATSELGSVAKRAAFDTLARKTDISTRKLVLMEHPALVGAIRRGGAFGGVFSQVVAQNRTAPARHIAVPAIRARIIIPPPLRSVGPLQRRGCIESYRDVQSTATGIPKKFRLRRRGHRFP